MKAKKIMFNAFNEITFPLPTVADENNIFI